MIYYTITITITVTILYYTILCQFVRAFQGSSGKTGYWNIQRKVHTARCQQTK